MWASRMEHKRNQHKRCEVVSCPSRVFRPNMTRTTQEEPLSSLSTFPRRWCGPLQSHASITAITMPILRTFLFWTGPTNAEPRCAEKETKKSAHEQQANLRGHATTERHAVAEDTFVNVSMQFMRFGCRAKSNALTTLPFFREHAVPRSERRHAVSQLRLLLPVSMRTTLHSDRFVYKVYASADVSVVSWTCRQREADTTTVEHQPRGNK